MADDQRRRVEDLFFSALDVPEERRAAYLADQEQHSRAEDSPVPLDGDSMAGRRLGAWQVVEEIGRGGMGTVYSAIRADQAFEKRVAIKVVKRGIDTDSVLARFRHERRILAALNHPYIAHLLDGGASDDNRPWFVMEFVEGQPIQDFCRDRMLGVKDRCRLFLKVCESVSYAHRNLVIHCDLKPANILVTAEGSPKLLDFGIARLLSAAPSGNTLLTTGGAASTLTPAYASPEQQCGEAVNTATDVYSLGAVLYEIFTGQMPAVHRHAGNERVIGKPSEAATDKSARAELAGDLDNIVLKATHPEQARRYGSVDELSEDLQRYLKGLPVTAREDRLGYRLNKFVRRHRLAVTMSALLLAGAFAGILTMLWESHRAELQRQRAEERLDQMVNLANHNLRDVHEAIERMPGALEARRQIVGATMRYLDQLARESGEDPRLMSALATGYARVAELKGSPPGQPSLGDWRGALEAYGQATRMLDALLAREPANRDLLLRRADVSREMGTALQVTQAMDEAEAELGRGLRAAQAVLDREPDNAEARKLKAQLQLEAYGLRSESEPAIATTKLLSVLPAFERLAADYPNDAQAVMPLAQATGFLGVCATLLGKTGEALTYYRRAATLFERVLVLEPHDVVAQRALLMQYSHLTGALHDSDQPADRAMAIVYARKQVAIAESLRAADPNNWIAMFDLTGGYARLASALPDSQLDESLRLFDQAHSMIQAAITSSTQHIPRVTLALATLDSMRGDRMQRAHRYRAALAYYRRSLDRTREIAAASSDASAALQAFEIEAEICGLLATLDERSEAVRTVNAMLGDARRLGPNWPSAIPKSLSTAGGTYAELAGKDDSEELRRQDWSSAANCFSGSLKAWARQPGTQREIEKDTRALAKCRQNLQPKADSR